jgi:uncharacterized protein (DUF58 family)
VTARLNEPFIKEFIEERDLRVFFVFDCSASGNFGNLVEKKKKALELTATLMFSAIRNNDNVGLILFSEDGEKFIPARKGKNTPMAILSNLISYSPRSLKNLTLRNLLSA